MNDSFTAFTKKYSWRPEYALQVGVERERYITDQAGTIVPRAESALKELNDPQHFSYEFSACQLEDKVGPCSLSDLRDKLIANEAKIRATLSGLGLKFLFQPVGPVDMPSDIYPDPTGRYQRIASRVLTAKQAHLARRVTSTHVHVGMPDPNSALRVYNSVIRHLPELSAAGDLSNGQRLRLYQALYPSAEPPAYKSWRQLYERAKQIGFAKDIGRCWDLIRISSFGTVEFRLFDSTEDIDKVVNWTRQCHHLCQKYLNK